MELVILLFVAGPMFAGSVSAAFCGCGTARSAAGAGAVGGLAVGFNLAAFGGFLYGPVVGAVGGLIAFAVIGPPPQPRDWSREPPAVDKGVVFDPDRAKPM